MAMTPRSAQRAAVAQRRRLLEPLLRHGGIARQAGAFHGGAAEGEQRRAVAARRRQPIPADGFRRILADAQPVLVKLADEGHRRRIGAVGVDALHGLAQRGDEIAALIGGEGGVGRHPRIAPVVGAGAPGVASGFAAGFCGNGAGAGAAGCARTAVEGDTSSAANSSARQMHDFATAAFGEPAAGRSSPVSHACLTPFSCLLHTCVTPRERYGRAARRRRRARRRRAARIGPARLRAGR